jgi:ubiquinone/menaquinone biosynthesis C-methylase UbiE
VKVDTPSGSDERQRVIEAYERRNDHGRYDPDRPDQIALAAARADAWRAALGAERRSLGRVVEVGCGTGAVARWSVHQGAGPLLGVDLQEERLRVAQAQLVAPTYALADARALPLRDGAVDTAICSTLFSSVLDEDVACDIAREIDRVVARDGMILWFDFFRRNPRNADVRPVGTEELGRWFPDWQPRLRRVVLAPPVARRLGRARRVADLLSGIPLLRTHYAGSLTRRPPS